MTHQDKFDRIELKVTLREPSEGRDFSQSYHLITQAVLINGENIAPENPIDLRDLAKSCQLSGEFFIVTCQCGNADCAGIDDGIRVEHRPDRITWEIPDPLSFRNLTDEEKKKHYSNRTYRRFSFDPAAYLAAVQEGLREARRLLFGELQPVECSPASFHPGHLLNLDPIVFTERGAPLGCRIVAEKIGIELSPGWVTINGIHYRLSELPVPESIKKLDDWSDWEPKRYGNGFAFNYAAAPAWEARRRMKLLGNHLAGITFGGGEIVITLREDWNNKRRYQLVLEGRAR
jgi:hypothetical protein